MEAVCFSHYSNTIFRCLPFIFLTIIFSLVGWLLCYFDCSALSTAELWRPAGEAGLVWLQLRMWPAITLKWVSNFGYGVLGENTLFSFFPFPCWHTQKESWFCCSGLKIRHWEERMQIAFYVLLCPRAWLPLGKNPVKSIKLYNYRSLF